MPAVGIADTNNMFGALEFSTTCAKQGIQPIIGMQVGLLLPHFKDSHGPLPSIF
ncbi:MAG: PHP domain-containing protein [Holosporaceae bacterium]|nr:MAG: PHP domain-containing protein [Holosporaceae bacterium]